MTKKRPDHVAYGLLKEAIRIATSEKPVTDDRLIVGEFLVDLAIEVLKKTYKLKEGTT